MLNPAPSSSDVPLNSLLQKIATVLSKSQTLPTRLNAVVRLIAEDMGSKMSLLYLLTPDHYLETYATYDALHPTDKKVRFRVGEGVVGFIASTGKSLICNNIANHPNFFFHPGVADHVNLSLLGTPLLSDKGIIGVLTLQDLPSKPFEKWRERGLVEIANYLSQLPELQHFPVLSLKEGKISGCQNLQGIPFNSGVAIGTAYIHQPFSWKETDFGQNPKRESQRLKDAIRETIEGIDNLVSSTANLDKETQEILESYRVIASDRGWVRKIQDYIQKGYTAEAAVQKVRRYTRERFAQIGDTVLKARLSDLEDLATRLLRHLSGREAISEAFADSTIVVARNLGPAELLDYDRRYIKGLLLEEGVHTAHVAIVARALDIPVVGRVPHVLAQVQKGDKLILDGAEGTVVVNPDAKALQAARTKIIQIKAWQVLNNEVRDKPCQTLDGIPIELTLNAGLPVDLKHLQDFSFKGVGLYRTEIPFMLRSSFPDVKAQVEIYQDVLEKAEDQSVIFRTLDIGGDKILPYMWQAEDENPVLGWRAIRVALDKPALLRHQVRALIQASHGRSLDLLFPMVSDIAEYRAARRLVEKELHRARQILTPLPSQVRYGIMLEVPSIVQQLESLLEEVDFVSLGTNDLFQFFFACDRTNPTVSNRYDTLSSSFLNYLKDIQKVCAKTKAHVSVCGEMAGKPIEALALLALGYRSFSIAGPAAGLVKKMILTLPLENAEAFLSAKLKTYHASLRASLTSFAEEYGVSLS